MGDEVKSVIFTDEVKWFRRRSSKNGVVLP